MRIPRAYIDEALVVGSLTELPDSSHNHLIKVLRLKEGFNVTLFNGDGYDYEATLVDVAKRSSKVRIAGRQKVEKESPLQIEIGQGLSRGERMDLAVQKSTELGVVRLTPLFTERSEVKLNAERQAKRSAHWQQISISASEQSQRAALMQVDEPTPLQQWISHCDADLKLVLHPHLNVTELAQHERPKRVAILIGPEGGLEEREVEFALAHGFQPWLLGHRILRTETAPIAAASVLNYLWGDFK